MTRTPKEGEGEVGPESNPVGAEPVSIATDLAWRRSPSGGGGGGGTLGERLARLEGLFDGFNRIVEGIRHSQNLMIGLVSLLALILIGLSVYELQRLDAMDAQIAQTNEHVNQIPEKVSTDVRELSETLANVITAARQPVPAPEPAPAPARKPKH